MTKILTEFTHNAQNSPILEDQILSWSHEQSTCWR